MALDSATRMDVAFHARSVTSMLDFAKSAVELNTISRRASLATNAEKKRKLIDWFVFGFIFLYFFFVIPI